MYASRPATTGFYPARRRLTACRGAGCCPTSTASNEKNQNAFPVADWSDKRVWTYINLHRLPICPTYGAHAIHSYEPHDPKAIVAMQQHYPDDVEKVLEYFPLLRAEIVKQQIKKRSHANPS